MPDKRGKVLDYQDIDHCERQRQTNLEKSHLTQNMSICVEYPQSSHWAR